MLLNPDITRFRLLMADDDEDDLDLMSTAFKEADFPTPLHGFNDGLKLLDYLVEHLSEKNPTLVVLDLNMPKNGGKVILKKIREIAGLKNIPVVVYSTSNADNDIIEAYELGCNAYVVKPNCYNEIKKLAIGIKQLWFNPNAILKFEL